MGLSPSSRKYNLPRLVTPIPHVKSSTRRPSSYTTYEPSPFVIIPSVIRPNPFVTCLAPKAYKFSALTASVANPLEEEGGEPWRTASGGTQCSWRHRLFFANCCLALRPETVIYNVTMMGAWAWGLHGSISAQIMRTSRPYSVHDG